jgi:hypothetical protein
MTDQIAASFVGLAFMAGFILGRAGCVQPSRMDADLKSALKPDAPLETVCAWCHPGDTRPNISHGICEKHRKEMLANTNQK